MTLHGLPVSKVKTKDFFLLALCRGRLFVADPNKTGLASPLLFCFSMCLCAFFLICSSSLPFEVMYPISSNGDTLGAQTLLDLV